MKPSLRRVFISTATITIAGGMFYLIAGPIGLIPVAVITMHELGHYIAALYTSSKVAHPPILIPAFPFLAGLTHVQGSENEAVVAYAGPITGLATSLAFLSLSLFFANPLALFVSAVLCATEFISLFISSDAKRARKWMKQKR